MMGREHGRLGVGAPIPLASLHSSLQLSLTQHSQLHAKARIAFGHAAFRMALADRGKHPTMSLTDHKMLFLLIRMAAASQELLQTGVDDEVTLAVAKNNLAAERMQAASTGPQHKRALADSLKHLDSLMTKVSLSSSPCPWQHAMGLQTSSHLHLRRLV